MPLACVDRPDGGRQSWRPGGGRANSGRMRVTPQPYRRNHCQYDRRRDQEQHTSDRRDPWSRSDSPHGRRPGLELE